jgi:hypothetical protein
MSASAGRASLSGFRDASHTPIAWLTRGAPVKRGGFEIIGHRCSQNLLRPGHSRLAGGVSWIA